ncbi:GIY-YIG nuclease family protein [Frigoribacterium sp. CFBP 13729]|uniref:GIY-YIG nuclease family protein n=1 Tax=Frigoribacterium sp. CFBP 13729 TaxID=2775293 RepID=UPI00177C38FC|nr:GIY-YIG nuclease family protein [Frigoribacterium sp. CFBP 13729]MBD8610212.1 GIY-YIG nuclease family protein [Frigoribacterium sp. CFBP 13729]
MTGSSSANRASSVCCVDGCGRPVEPGAPAPLCAWHLDAAADWSEREHGLTDLLPSPCVACGSRLGVHWPSGWLCAVCEWRHGDSPDGELAPPRVDVVYYLRFDDRIKIGTSSDPRRRLARIWHDDLLAFERGDRLVEHRRHVQFAEHRLARTEWFTAAPELLAHAATLRAGSDDPWSSYARWRSEALALRS